MSKLLIFVSVDHVHSFWILTEKKKLTIIFMKKNCKFFVIGRPLHDVRCLCDGSTSPRRDNRRPNRWKWCHIQLRCQRNHQETSRIQTSSWLNAKFSWKKNNWNGIHWLWLLNNLTRTLLVFKKKRHFTL